MPKVEDGNNFGVEVQEQCIAQLKQFEIESLMLFEEQVKNIKKYMRAKIILGSVSLGARNDHLKNQPDFRNPRLQAVYLRKRRAKMQKTTGKRLQATG